MVTYANTEGTFVKRDSVETTRGHLKWWRYSPDYKHLF
nr:MAG TPA: hypothetical protein [Bacteriophage sp.]